MVAARARESSYWDVSGAIGASVVLWLLPIFAKFDARYLLTTNALALGASIYGASESARLLKQNKHSSLEDLIGNEVTQEYVELETQRRVAVLQQQYGILSTAQQPALQPEIVEEEWQPVNPFALSNEAGRLVGSLAEFGIEVAHQGEIATASFIRHKIKPAASVKVSKIAQAAEDIQVKMGLDSRPIIAAANGYVAIDLPRADRQVLMFPKYVQPDKRTIDDPMEMAIGVGIDGKLVECDLSSPDWCHWLIAGTTGGGKSALIRAMLYSVFDRYPPALVRYSMFSEKKSEYPDLNTANPWQLAPTMTTPEEWIDHLKTMVVPEMEGRDEIFEESGCKDIVIYNEKLRDAPLPHWLILCDGYAEAIDQLSGQGDKAAIKELETALMRLAQRARSVGIHLILATQRPDGKLINPRIRSNLPARICLKVRSDADSEIATGEKRLGGESLLGKGDMLLVGAGKVDRLQSLFVDNQRIDEFAQQWQDYQPDAIPTGAPTPQPAVTVEPEAKSQPEATRAKKSDNRFSGEYLEYLKSPEWQQRRTRILERDGHRCAGCHSPEGLQVHHRIYPPKGSPLQAFVEQPDEEFTTICKSCHNALTNSIRARRKARKK